MSNYKLLYSLIVVLVPACMQAYIVKTTVLANAAGKQVVLYGDVHLSSGGDHDILFINQLKSALTGENQPKIFYEGPSALNTKLMCAEFKELTLAKVEQACLAYPTQTFNCECRTFLLPAQAPLLYRQALDMLAHEPVCDDESGQAQEMRKRKLIINDPEFIQVVAQHPSVISSLFSQGLLDLDDKIGQLEDETLKIACAEKLERVIQNCMLSIDELMVISASSLKDLPNTFMENLFQTLFFSTMSVLDVNTIYQLVTSDNQKNIVIAGLGHTEHIAHQLCKNGFMTVYESQLKDSDGAEIPLQVTENDWDHYLETAQLNLAGRVFQPISVADLSFLT